MVQYKIIGAFLKKLPEKSEQLNLSWNRCGQTYGEKVENLTPFRHSNDLLKSIMSTAIVCNCKFCKMFYPNLGFSLYIVYFEFYFSDCIFLIVNSMYFYKQLTLISMLNYNYLLQI